MLLAPRSEQRHASAVTVSLFSWCVCGVELLCCSLSHHQLVVEEKMVLSDADCTHSSATDMPNANYMPLPTPAAESNAQQNTDGIQLQALVTKLLPVLAAKLNANASPEGKVCSCKCASKLNTLQEHYNRLMKTVQGYKSQVDSWKDKVRTLQSDVNAANSARAKEKKQMNVSSTKIEQFTATHTAMKNSLQQLNTFKKAQTEEIKQIKDTLAKKTNNFDPTEIVDSQKFINEEFEKLKENVITDKGNLQNQIHEVAQVIEYNVKNTTRQRQYSREECLVVTGITESAQEGSNNAENDSTLNSNCAESKKAIIDLCKELNLVVHPDKISIAHRIKKGRYAKGPRPIVVKFTSKEVCREVYALRKACKEITEWGFDRSANKIYINESLTPEKRKLLYDTKQAVNKELYETHGIIYVWTHRGDVYVRKNGTGSPKIRVNSQLELQHLLQGRISLDTESNAPSVPNLIHWTYVKDPWSLRINTRSRPPQNRPHLHPANTSTDTHTRQLSFEVEHV